jgi:GNAT superfamily N-acetyltransferase
MRVVWQKKAIIRALSKKPFDCGEGALNKFFRQYAYTHHNRGASATFVAVDPKDPKCVLGYYTICPSELKRDDATDELKAIFPRYPISGFRLARLAVDKTIHGQGLGGQLLLDAGEYAIQAAGLVGGSILIIDAKNAALATWYERFTAKPLPDHPLTLVIRLETLAMSFGILFPQPATGGQVVGGL